MPNYNDFNFNLQDQQQMQRAQMGNPQMVSPRGNNNMLLSNNPYNNYMGNQRIESQDLLSYQFLKCRPVSSKDEARACQIDLDGSLWVFTDLGNDKIYTKQINKDGTATFRTYSFVEDESPYGSNEYVTKEEFNKVVQTLMAAIQPVNPQESKNNVNENKTQLVGF